MDWDQGYFGQDSFHITNTLTACPTRYHTLQEDVSMLPPIWSRNSKLILKVRVSAPRWRDCGKRHKLSLWPYSDSVTHWNVHWRMVGTHIPPFARFHANLGLGQGCLTILQKKKQLWDGHKGKHCMVKTLTMEEGELGLITTANSADECTEWRIPRL